MRPQSRHQRIIAQLQARHPNPPAKSVQTEPTLHRFESHPAHSDQLPVYDLLDKGPGRCLPTRTFVGELDPPRRDAPMLLGVPVLPAVWRRWIARKLRRPAVVEYPRIDRFDLIVLAGSRR